MSDLLGRIFEAWLAQHRTELSEAAEAFEEQALAARGHATDIEARARVEHYRGISQGLRIASTSIDDVLVEIQRP